MARIETIFIERRRFMNPAIFVIIAAGILAGPYPQIDRPAFRIGWNEYPTIGATFEIWRAQSAGEFALIASNIDPANMDWIDTTITINRRYEYRARAMRNNIYSVFSYGVSGISFHIGPTDTITYYYYGDDPDGDGRGRNMLRIHGPRVRWIIESWQYETGGDSWDAFAIRAFVDRLPPFGVVNLSDFSIADPSEIDEIRALYGKPCRFYPVFRH